MSNTLDHGNQHKNHQIYKNNPPTSPDIVSTPISILSKPCPAPSNPNLQLNLAIKLSVQIHGPYTDM